MLIERKLLSTVFLWHLLTNGLCLLAAPPDEDDEEFRPGLIAEYRVGEQVVTRIDPDVAFAWDEAAPDSRLSAERFEATWRGFLLVRLEAKHRLHAFVQGEVTVELDGRRVLHGSAKQPQWISGDEFVPGFAERPLVVTFRKTEPAAQLKLFWMSDVFSLEPLPPELLFHDDTSFNPNANGVGADGAKNKSTPAHADGIAVKLLANNLALIELGRKQFEAFRCGRCHQRDGEERPPPGPSLKHFAASGVVDDVVSRHLSPFAETGRFYPTFGSHDPDYDAIQVFLHQQSQPVELDKPKPVKEADLETERRKGEVLLRSTGCLACHRIGELGGTSPSPFAGPDLSNVGERRTLPWLVTWLKSPERLNADHRMPVFNLSEAERNQIALALWNLTSEPDAKESRRLTAEEFAKNWKHYNDFKSSKNEKTQAAYKSQTERGRKLAIELRCAACHRFSDDEAVRPQKPVSDLSQAVADWSKSCLAERADHAQLDRPIFGTNLNRDAIKAYLASRRETKLSPLSTFARGQRLLEQKGCLACHSRHGLGGFGKMVAQVAKFDKDLNGQAPSLVPPSLNAVGDKLLDEALRIAVRGERQPIRMPWLNVRMPKFKHSPDELAQLTNYFIEHDRIPTLPAHLAPAAMSSVPSPRRGEGRGAGPSESLQTTKTNAAREKSSSKDAGKVSQGSDPRPLSLTLSPAGRGDQTAGGPTGRGDMQVSADTLLAGQSLMSVKGWSCIACHKIGDYEPKQVALGARGSDLRLLGKHLRPEFFFRWIASPLRVVPGVEMPSYNKPVAGVLDDDLSKQHAALWQALNDPNFQPPTNPNNVEQLWVVNPGERPRIIRDVFLVPSPLRGEGQGEGLLKAPQTSVPRAFAVGFDNGHSLLFDAETASIRQWTFGDFARQQVVGKRWFWEMAGIDVLRGLPPMQFALRDKTDSKRPIRVASSDNPIVMGTFAPTASGIRLTHWLNFPTEKDAKGWGDIDAIYVEETLEPFTEKESKPERAGIQRTLRMNWFSGGSGVDYELWYGRPALSEIVGHPRIDVIDGYVTEGKKRTPWGTGKFAWQQLISRDQPGGQLEWTELPIRDRKAETGKIIDAKAPSPPPLEGHATIVYSAELQRNELPTAVKPATRSATQSEVRSVPGFDGVQLPLDASIMPTGFAWRPNGQLIFSSLKGHVFAAQDENGDQIEDRLRLLHEGLCAPYGVLIPEETQVRGALGEVVEMTNRTLSNSGVLVATKSELTLSIDTDGDGYCERQEVGSSGWGYTDDYHEWTSSPVRDSKGNVFFGLASDYTDKNRPKERSLWRGKVMRQKPDWRVSRWPSQPIEFLDKEGRDNLRDLLAPVGHAFRYPTGIAINDRDEVFVSDQQGVQNCFNEINYLVEGAHYGVPATHEEDKDAPETKAAIQIPHPWTRSVNGIVFLTGKEGYPDLKGHGIGCEYNNKFLIRFTTQRVGDVMQGAVYPFSMPEDELARRAEVTPKGQQSVSGKALAAGAGDEKQRDSPAASDLPLTKAGSIANFQGPLCIGVNPKGQIYIGSIADSGWAGGQNTGSIVQLKANGQRPNGIREIRATRDGFDIEFFAPVDRARATNPEHYSISGYTRVWGGAYATPDSDRHRCKVLSAALSQDSQTAHLQVDPRKTPNYVYDISCRDVADPDKPFFPAYGFYTLHRIP